MTPVVRQRLIQFFWVALFVSALLAARVFDVGLFSTLRGAGFDQLQRLYPRELTEPQPVRIVDIDEASLKALGQWPWSRITLAQLVENLLQLGAAAIAFDIVFPEPDRLSPRRVMMDPNLAATLPSTMDATKLPDSDAIFAAALSGKPTIMAFASTAGQPDATRLVVKSGFAQTGAPAGDAPPRLGRMIVNLPAFDANAAGIGGINIDLAGEQGIARQIPLLWSDGTRLAPSLSVEALRVAQGADTLLVNAAAETENALESIRVGDIEIPVSETGMFYVHYRPNPTDLYVSAVDVLDAQKREALRPQIEGNIVFIGTSAVGLLDVRTTALGENVPGVSIHAQATEQMLTGRFLSRPEWAVALELLLVLAGGLAIAAVGAIYRPLTAFSLTALFGVICLASTLYAFKVPGLLLDFTFPLITLILSSLASTAYRLVVTDRDGRTMRRMFGHYVAASVLDDIERNPQNLKLGGEVRDVTVMFVDVANFTPLSEKLTPEELVQTINGLWNVCTSAILEQQGTIDKFIGDAIMAFWNAPVAVENHQWHAAKAALAIRKAVVAYNATPSVQALLALHDIPPIALRIGLASGPACVGNMGSSDRFDYTVIGETVNTAARTEATCKHVAHDILLAGKLHTATQNLAVLSAGRAAMKGKSQAEEIHALISDETEALTTGFSELRREHDHLIAKLVDKPSAGGRATIQQLLDEVALHHPICASYLRALAGRSADFATVRPPRGRE
jgi:adenylate cyclase